MNPPDDRPTAILAGCLAPRTEERLGMRLRLHPRTCGLVTALLAVAGCAAGPNYHAPKTEVPSGFANGTATNTASNETAVTWWRGFDDVRLTALVEMALTNNHDLRVAAAQVREARALRRETQFDLGPTVDTRAGYLNQQFSEAALFEAPVATRHREFYDVGFDATWELDFFGHVRRSIQAATADAEAADAHRRDVQVTLIAEVARNYFELRGAQNELLVARRNAENQRETLNLTQARLEGGRGTDFDVARARAQMNTTLAAVPPLEAAVTRAIHRLSVLVGRQPTNLVPELSQTVSLPTFPSQVSIGNPEALLRRRPDVRAAERVLAAATARIGVATADLFPRVTFNGSIGLEATRIAGLGKTGSDAWSFGPSIHWAALDLGHVRARIQAAGAHADAALAAYERTVLTSLEETENALVDFGREQARREYLRESVEASQRAAVLARQRYDAGATDFLGVLDAERVLYDAQDQLARSETRAATALVAVYKSLGGGWEIETTGQERSPPP